jgi:hypothetical protein
MNLSFSPLSVLLAAFAPLLVLILVMVWDCRQRKRTEKPPQTGKLLRPPGYSLSIRLERTFDSVLDCLINSIGSFRFFRRWCGFSRWFTWFKAGR